MIIFDILSKFGPQSNYAQTTFQYYAFQILPKIAFFYSVPRFDLHHNSILPQNHSEQPTPIPLLYYSYSTVALSLKIRRYQTHITFKYFGSSVSKYLFCVLYCCLLVYFICPVYQ